MIGIRIKIFYIYVDRSCKGKSVVNAVFVKLLPDLYQSRYNSSAINVNTDTSSAINVKRDTSIKSINAKPIGTISARMFQRGPNYSQHCNQSEVSYNWYLGMFRLTNMRIAVIITRGILYYYKDYKDLFTHKYMNTYINGVV